MNHKEIYRPRTSELSKKAISGELIPYTEDSMSMKRNISIGQTIGRGEVARRKKEKVLFRRNIGNRRFFSSNYPINITTGRSSPHREESRTKRARKECTKKRLPQRQFNNKLAGTGKGTFIFFPRHCQNVRAVYTYGRSRRSHLLRKRQIIRTHE